MKKEEYLTCQATGRIQTWGLYSLADKCVISTYRIPDTGQVTSLTDSHLCHTLRIYCSSSTTWELEYYYATVILCPCSHTWNIDK